ncbi:MAG: VOC family protein [Acidobacteriota bacterium]
MERVQGIGGVFFKSRNPKVLAAWYKQHLGVPVESWGGASFRWRELDARGEASTAWSLFPEDTTYFAPGTASFMVNYRVDDLAAMIAQLRAGGVEVDEKIEESEFGKFGWGLDPEGNRFELWESPPSL